MHFARISMSNEANGASHILRRFDMNAHQNIDIFDTPQNGLSISEMISSGVYKLVVAIERAIRAL